MCRLLVVVALVGCAPRAANGPTWPHQHFADRDGGESLAPRQPKQIAVASPRVEDAKPAAPKAIAMPATPTATVGDAPAPAVIAPVVQPTEEILTTEDIIIEIDD
jgi:hypothetical protein